mmetsp:Transcript_6291/g.17668  ORF Transcript_6291/g.17668 Transcript_6291/m.17668 type:complete len:217 (-) Transcript_6291:21-671(-)
MVYPRGGTRTVRAGGSALRLFAAEGAVPLQQLGVQRHDGLVVLLRDLGDLLVELHGTAHGHHALPVDLPELLAVLRQLLHVGRVDVLPQALDLAQGLGEVLQLLCVLHNVVPLRVSVEHDVRRARVFALQPLLHGVHALLKLHQLLLLLEHRIDLACKLSDAASEGCLRRLVAAGRQPRRPVGTRRPKVCLACCHTLREVGDLARQRRLVAHGCPN